MSTIVHRRDPNPANKETYDEKYDRSKKVVASLERSWKD